MLPRFTQSYGAWGLWEKCSHLGWPHSMLMLSLWASSPLDVGDPGLQVSLLQPAVVSICIRAG